MADKDSLDTGSLLRLIETYMSGSSEFATVVHQELPRFKTGVLVIAGKPSAGRPVAVASIEEATEIWFATSLGAAEVGDLIREPAVCVVMQQEQTFLSLSGEAQVVYDRARIKQLWNDEWKNWFPEGQMDSSIALVKLQLEEGRLWSDTGLAGKKFRFDDGRFCESDTDI